MNKKVIAISWLSFLVIQSAFANQIQDIVSYTLSTNPQIVEKRKQLEGAYSELRTSKGSYLPNVDLSASYGTSQDKSQLTNQQLLTYNPIIKSLTVTENIFSGFSHQNEIAMRRKMVESKKFALIQQMNDVALSVSKGYINVIRSQHIKDVENDNVKQMEQFYKNTKIQLEHGSGKLSDLKESSAKLSLAYANYITAENSFQDNLAALRKILGQYPKMDELKRPEIKFALPSTFHEHFQKSLKNNPSLFVSHYQVDASKHTIEMEKSSYYPKIDLQLLAKQSENSSGMAGTNDTTSALVTLTYNLYQGGKTKSKVQKSVIDLQEQISKQGSVKREVAENARLSWNAYVNLSQQLEYLEFYKEATSEKIKAYKDEFELGRRTLVELSQAQAEHNLARQKWIQSDFDLLTAKIRVLHAQGELLQGLGIDTSAYTTEEEPQAFKSDDKPLCDDESATVNFPAGPMGYKFINLKESLKLSQSQHFTVSNEMIKDGALPPRNESTPLSSPVFHPQAPLLKTESLQESLARIGMGGKLAKKDVKPKSKEPSVQNDQPVSRGWLLPPKEKSSLNTTPNLETKKLTTPTKKEVVAPKTSPQVSFLHNSAIKPKLINRSSAMQNQDKALTSRATENKESRTTKPYLTKGLNSD